MKPTVDEIPHEQKLAGRKFRRDPKQLSQIIKLTVDIPDDCDWSL